VGEDSSASRLHRLFAGAQRSHGTYAEEDEELGGKRTIRRTARTLREGPTARMWEEHLAGRRPLGIVPIDEEDSCVWGAVDVDDYTVDIPALVGELRTLGIPAICCRTKSGGCHVYLFFSEKIPAADVIPRLRELAALIGHGSSEIFPKQRTVLADRGDLGSWLNMPYFGGDRTERYAVRPDGRGLSVEGFLSAAEGVRLSRRGLADLVLQRRTQGFETGPPCLESLISTGFPPHTRNNGVLALGVLAKKMSPDGWEALLERWVKAHAGDPPFPAADLASVVRSLRKKDYNYRCGDTPLNQRCNVALCRTRQHGVGGGSSVSVLESASILMTDPPIFFVVLKTGGTVELGAQQILSPHEFQLAALIQLREVLPEYRRGDWMSWVRGVIESATTIEVPRESGNRGKFEEILERFVTDQYKAETRDEILMGKPWLNEEIGVVHFRLRDLESALDRARFTSPERSVSLRSWVTARLRGMGGESTQFWVRGRNVNVWNLRSELFSWMTESASLPVEREGPL